MQRGVMAGLTALVMGCATPEVPVVERLFDTLDLVFTPVDGGDEVRATWNDPPGTGEPTSEPARLRSTTDWQLSVEMTNERERPVVDASAVVQSLNWEYQLFFTGTVVEGPATGSNPIAPLTHAYADEDQTGLPLGLENTLEIRSSGRGTLAVRVQRFPLDNGSLVKDEGFAEIVAAQGFDALPGEVDGEVEFTVTVQ